MNITLGKPLAVSDKGRRGNNEDSIFPLSEIVSSADRLYMVCDGVGGASRGEVASSMACDVINSFFCTFLKGDPDVDFVNKAVQYVETCFDTYTSDYPEAIGMATTLALAYIMPSAVLIAHIGDSRIYHLRKGKILYRTEDHSLVNELIKEGELSPEEAEHHPKKNIITRSLGISENSELDEEFFQLTKNSILMLCTDGLTNMVEDTKLERLLNISESLPDKCQRLVDEANRAGGNDNISVLLVSFDEEVKY